MQASYSIRRAMFERSRKGNANIDHKRTGTVEVTKPIPATPNARRLDYVVPREGQGVFLTRMREHIANSKRGVLGISELKSPPFARPKTANVREYVPPVTIPASECSPSPLGGIEPKVIGHHWPPDYSSEWPVVRSMYDRYYATV